MGKSKKSDTHESANRNDIVGESSRIKISWEDKVKHLSPISNPLATKKLTKKIYKIISKARSNNSLRKGIKEVQKSLRKGEKGIVILAGDVSPLDIISHIPVICEEADIPYCYTPSKYELGESYGSKRQACMVLIKEHAAYQEDFEECKSRISCIPISY